MYATKNRSLIIPRNLLLIGFLLLPFTFLRIYKNFSIGDLLGILSFLYLILVFNRKWFEDFFKNNIYFTPLLILTAGFLFSLGNAYKPGESITAYIQIFFIFGVIYPLLLINFNSELYIKRALVLLVISTGVISLALFVFIQLADKYTLGLFMLEKGWGGKRFSYGGQEPNITGRIILQIIPLCSVFYIIAKNKLIKVLNLVLILISVYVVTMTASRSCLLAMLLGIILFPVFLRKINPEIKLSKLLIISGIILIFLLSYLLINNSMAVALDRYSTIFFVKSSASSLQRISLIEQAIGYIVKNPLIGTGLGNFEIFTDEQINVHNPILSMWAENGIFGMIGFSLIYFILIIHCIKAYRYNFFGSYLLMGMAIMVIIMIFGDMFMANSYKRVLWLPSILFIKYFEILLKQKVYVQKNK